MGLCGKREKSEHIKAEQKWDYINLSDFKSTSCLTPMSYGILYISLLISVAVYAVDVFIAVNLLFYDRWTGSVKPVALNITKWVFAGCILLSFINLAFEWTRAVRVMKRGGVAESYLDPLAVRIQSIRPGKNGRGWRRFLVFAELTKSRKGVEYVALFSYFSFKAWLRIVVCEGPQKVINALTLYKVLRASLIPEGQNAAPQGKSPFIQFWVNIGILADKSRTEALILGSMTFTLFIWVFAALNLIIACVMYILFLWHYVPSTDKGLSRFLKRKIDGRVARVVGATVQKALEKEDVKRREQEEKAIKAGGRVSVVKRQPTLPVLTMEGGNAEPMPPIPRRTTDTYPPSGTPSPDATPTPPHLNRPPPPFSRSGTQSTASSNISYASNAPLMGHAAELGQCQPGRSQSPRPAMPQGFSELGGDLPGGPSMRAGPGLPMTPMPRPGTAQSRSTSLVSEGRGTPAPGFAPGPFAPPGRRTPGPQDSRGRAPPRQFMPEGRRTPVPDFDFGIGVAKSDVSDEGSHGGYNAITSDMPHPPPRSASATPAPYGPARSAASTPAPYGPPRSAASTPAPYGPPRSASSTPAPYGPPRSAASTPAPYGAPPRSTSTPRPFSPQETRSFTSPHPPRGASRTPHPPQRSGTAPLPKSQAQHPPSRHQYADSILDAYGGSDDTAGVAEPYGGRGPPPRAATASPGPAGQPRYAGAGAGEQPPRDWRGGVDHNAF
ncbi:MAG: hypothetical protein M1832_000191 [Thelocarpon impressellum]|nr:MAG: hypothetical protein M1832_000191 [Thelocarpon impressellum]